MRVRVVERDSARVETAPGAVLRGVEAADRGERAVRPEGRLHRRTAAIHA